MSLSQRIVGGLHDRLWVTALLLFLLGVWAATPVVIVWWWVAEMLRRD